MTSPWRELCGLDAYQITEIPRWPDGETPGASGQGQDPGRPGRIAALVAAYHAGGAVAYGWMRLRAGGPIQILAAGSALAGSNGNGDVVLALPGGARGRALGRGALVPALSALACWRAIGGISDGLLMSTGEPPPGRQEAAPSLEECLLPAWAGPFGWIVVAEPLPPQDVEWLADEAARRERLAMGMADRFPERDVEARRLRHRHTELRQGLSTGMWRVHLLAGGTDPAAAARVAGLVCASADLRGLPYTLAPARAGAGALRDLLGSPAAATTTVSARPPGRDTGDDPRARHPGDPPTRHRRRSPDATPERLPGARPRRPRQANRPVARPERAPRTRQAAAGALFTPAPGCSRRWPGPRKRRYPGSGWPCARTSTSPRKRPRPAPARGPRRNWRQWRWARCSTGSGIRRGRCVSRWTR